MQSYEGLEAHLIYIGGGDISVTASDDGLNANGGQSMLGGMFPNGKGESKAENENSTTPTLKITGGKLYVNAGGDGLDSNGDLIIDGGDIAVDGPVNGANGALDSGTENGGSILCNGGTVIAIGASGMAETFEDTSKQCSFIKSFDSSFEAGTVITISDEQGNVIYKHTSAKSFSSIVFSSPDLKLGSTYTITMGDETDTVTIESISNGGSPSFGNRVPDKVNRDSL